MTRTLSAITRVGYPEPLAGGTILQGTRVPVELATSRYGNEFVTECGMLPVGFTKGNRRGAARYKLAANLRELAPDRSIWKFDDKAFAAAYRLQLDRLGFEAIAARLNKLAVEHGNNRIVLLCFEDVRRPGKSCHRQNFAAYWQEMTGDIVPELEDCGPAGVNRKASHHHDPLLELEDKGTTDGTYAVSPKDSVSAAKLAAMFGAWAGKNGHTLVMKPKSIQVRLGGNGVILSVFPGWDSVYFEISKLIDRGLDPEAEAILGHLRDVSSRPLTGKQPGVLGADLRAHWGTVEGKILPLLVNAYRIVRRP